jgi:hypothetical protein
LLEIVRTLHSARRLPRRLHSGQQQTNQYPNDGNHNQQFNKRKPNSFPTLHLVHHPTEFHGPSNSLRVTRPRHVNYLTKTQRKQLQNNPIATKLHKRINIKIIKRTLSSKETT